MQNYMPYSSKDSMGSGSSKESQSKPNQLKQNCLTRSAQSKYLLNTFKDSHVLNTLKVFCFGNLSKHLVPTCN